MRTDVRASAPYPARGRPLRSGMRGGVVARGVGVPRPSSSSWPERDSVQGGRRARSGARGGAGRAPSHSPVEARTWSRECRWVCADPAELRGGSAGRSPLQHPSPRTSGCRPRGRPTSRQERGLHPSSAAPTATSRSVRSSGDSPALRITVGKRALRDVAPGPRGVSRFSGRRPAPKSVRTHKARARGHEGSRRVAEFRQSAWRSPSAMGVATRDFEDRCDFPSPADAGRSAAVCRLCFPPSLPPCRRRRNSNRRASRVSPLLRS